MKHNTTSHMAQYSETNNTTLHKTKYTKQQARFNTTMHTTYIIHHITHNATYMTQHHIIHNTTYMIQLHTTHNTAYTLQQNTTYYNRSCTAQQMSTAKYSIEQHLHCFIYNIHKTYNTTLYTSPSLNFKCSTTVIINYTTTQIIHKTTLQNTKQPNINTQRHISQWPTL